MRTVVIVSPFFVPSPLASVHRARHLARHLPAFGWRPIVLSVDERHYAERLDHSLAALVADETTVVKVGALPAAVARCVGVGDISVRGWWQLRAGLVRLLETERVDAVLMTAAPNYALMLAPLIKTRFGVPVVIDFQDPWVSAWGEKQRRWSKAGLAHAVATRLEPEAIGAADFLTVVSERQREELLARYGWLERQRTAAIPIGYDEADLTIAMKWPGPDEGAAGTREGAIDISYVGSYWPAARPTFMALFRGLAHLRSRDPGIARRLRLRFIGTDATARSGRPQVQAMAEGSGVGDMVLEAPRRVPYLEALHHMATADGLLLLGSGEPHYSASKIYAALMSGRPYLSLFHGDSDAHRLLAAAGGGMALSFGGEDELAALEGAVADGLRRLAFEPESLGTADEAVFGKFQARHIAKRFGAILDGVVQAKAAAYT